MKALIVGSGGREHALGWKLAASKDIDAIYFAPGNGGTAQLGTNISVAMDDVAGLLQFAQEKDIDLTVVGQEAALEEGIVNEFTKAGLQIFGPTKQAAEIETSKAFSSDFVKRHNIPHPEFVTVDTLEAALNYIREHQAEDYVIKADGLATGKGVILPQTTEEAEQTVKDMLSGKAFGAAGSKIVFQERLHGQEVSTFALSDGKNVLMLPFFQDHKPVFEGDRGPNTGGMGAYTPVPIVAKQLAQQIKEQIMHPAIAGLSKDGREYRGILYGGLIVTKGGPKVIEFNARFGDPEAQAMMLMLDEDLLPLLVGSASGKLPERAIKLKPGAAATVALASGGYPGEYKKGIPITGLGKVSDPEVVVFHAGTKKEASGFVTSGGRVLNVTAYGKDLRNALDKAYKAIEDIKFEGMQYRRDIGAKAFI